ncbi:putative oxidoreductase [Actinoplanes lobatus]|uniref:Putative oxidoreductase n=1 Tax=Actinoplanes lobatus TaxID=113568 RepID=A0A7W7HJX5_9ACTN|nr:putative oxidoreductase [Actinoplanes lobatus]
MKHEIRAVYDDSTITVYQAYSPLIAVPAVSAGRFVPPFKRERMTWIKPSFLWMMYRCGWATKPGQEHVLAISITRAGFEWALDNAVLSHYVRDVHPDRVTWQRALKQAPTRVQWDPERDLHLRELPYRSLQLGLGGVAVPRYADEWITGITDVTPLVRRIRGHLDARDVDAATALLPVERLYPYHRDPARM